MLNTYVWVGLHCTLYPSPPHTIHPPLTDAVPRGICELYFGGSGYKVQC